MELKYRTDIDGLRGIAVLAVLFFHTDVPGFSGGFVGVDVFFVISGFLITSIILKDIQAERFSIARFYERRIRRIFPALFPLIAFVLVVGAYLFDAPSFKSLGDSVVATTLFASNILFCRESGYFDTSSLLKPLLHTWSLAVEEQFYIFFPIALMLISRYLKGRFILWVSVAFITSFAISIYGVGNHMASTFYLVHTRAWELMAGSLLALRALPAPSTIWQKNLFAFSGIALITASIALISESTPFPGAAAIPPVLGASLIIYSGMGTGKFVLQKLLSFKPLVFIGLISYSLYLWHWPLVAFSKFLLFRKFNGFDSAGIIFSSIAFASFSWKFIEQPFREKKPLIPERKRLFVLSGLIMLTTGATGAIIDMREGVSGRLTRFYPVLTETLREAMNYSYWERYKQWEKTDITISRKATPPVVGSETAKPSFVLWGDSHAMALIPAIQAQAQKNGLSGHVLFRRGTPALLDVDRSGALEFDSEIANSSQWNKQVLEFIRIHPEIRTVLITCRWSIYVTGKRYKQENGNQIAWQDLKKTIRNGQPNKYYVKAGLDRTIDALISMNRKIVLISDVPEIGYNVPNAYYVNYRWPALLDIETIRPSIAEHRDRQKEADMILEKVAARPGVILIRPENKMFESDGKVRIMNDGQLLYRDENHLSKSGSLYVAPAFDALFKEMSR